MNILKNIWKEEDINEFNKYLVSLKKSDSEKRTKKIVYSNKKIIGLNNKECIEIAKQIKKGNYLSFLNLMSFEYYENTLINAYLISKIRKFDLLKKYLDVFVNNIDCSTSCDTLDFYIGKKKEKYFMIALSYLESDNPYARIVAFIILSKYIEDNKYIDEIFNIMNRFYDEEDMNVNTIIAWLFCECFVKQRDKSILFLSEHNLNKTAINIAVQKCRYCHRIDKEDRIALLKYRKR